MKSGYKDKIREKGNSWPGFSHLPISLGTFKTDFCFMNK